jgi:hypothetical protein
MEEMRRAHMRNEKISIEQKGTMVLLMCFNDVSCLSESKVTVMAYNKERIELNGNEPKL